MTNYQYIVDLFTEVLKSSKAIQGRFHVAYRFALQEANYDQLGEVLKDIKYDKKYPMVVMAPPTSQMRIGGQRVGWETFRIILYFVKTSFYGEGSDISQRTNTSQHPVHQDWHDMKRCAYNFLMAVQNLRQSGVSMPFNIPQHDILCQPVSHVGADRASGVHINFDFQLYTGCEVEDYDDYPTEVNIELDGHPEHRI